MVGKVGAQTDFARLDLDLRGISERAKGSTPATSSSSESAFADLLKNGVEAVNKSLVEADKASMDLATGKSSNIHSAMLAATRAELGFNMLVQLRNKAIEAYQEVMRMQV